MTSTSLAEDEVEAAPRDSRFIGGASELLAVGGLTLVLLPLSWLLRTAVGLEAAELAVGFTMFHAAHFLNDPHFAVTYVLFYENARARALGEGLAPAQRTRWLVAGIVVPLVLVVWAALALVTRSAQTLGWMVQLMFLLVGWHYAKQGFGVLTVLSLRRGVRFLDRERQVILAHCYAAWAFAWVSPASAAGEFEEKGVVYWAPSHPHWLELVTGSALAVSTIAVVLVLAAKWRREGGLPFTPLVGFVVTIWLWTIFTSLDPLVRYVIPALHGVQYGYFVWLMKRNQARAAEGPPTFGPPASTRITWLAVTGVVLGYLLFRGGPWALDTSIAASWATEPTREALGATPFFAAIFVVVNLHHYFMDHVIWRRESPETRFLQDPAPQ